MANLMSAQDQLDMELMAEAELSRLKRQFRIMEGDRKAYYDDITIKLSKQRKIIARLTLEKSNLFDNIQAASCRTQKRKNAKVTSKMSLLLQQHGESLEKLHQQTKRFNEINKQIEKTEKEINILRLNEIPMNEYGERIKSGEKSVKMLENKLQTVIKRFCCVLTQNKEMRKEIDHLLNDRTRFNGIWEQLIVDLNSGKRFMMDLVEQATLAYDQREEWCSKLQALKIRAHNDVIGHTQEMREMQRQLDHDGKLREFLTTKSQRRVMRDLELKELKKHQQETQTIEHQQQIYKDTLEKIHEFCKEIEIERIVTKYLKQEEENFALFNYVNELNHELEQLNENIKEYKESILDYVEKSEERNQKQIKTLDTLTVDLEKTKEQRICDENKAQHIKNELDSILGEIKSLFELLQCDCAPILDLLGEKARINEDNVFIYLGLVERKISSLITDIYFKEKSLLKKRVKQ